MYTWTVTTHEGTLSREDLRLCLFSGAALRYASENTIYALSKFPTYSLPGADHAACRSALCAWVNGRPNLRSPSFARNPVWHLKKFEDGMSNALVLQMNPETSTIPTLYRC